MNLSSSGTTALMDSKKPSGRKRGRKPTGRTPTVPLLARVSPSLAEALQRYIDEQRPAPSQNSVLETAIEDFLAAKGFWPPKPDAGEGE